MDDVKALQRFSLASPIVGGVSTQVDPDGEWVRYADVLDALAAPRPSGERHECEEWCSACRSRYQLQRSEAQIVASSTRPSGEREAPASGERPAIKVGDWVLEDERDATPFVVRADNLHYWNDPAIVVTLLEVRGERNGVALVWRRS